MASVRVKQSKNVQHSWELKVWTQRHFVPVPRHWLTSGVLMINEVVCCLAVVCLVSRKGNFPPRIWLAYITNNEGAQCFLLEE